MEPTQPSRHPDPGEPVLRSLERTRRTLRRTLLVERTCQAIAFGILAVMVAAFLDRTLRMPPALRAAELAALCVGGAWWAWTKVLPSMRFAPGLVDVALRLERGNDGARGVLAVGADLAQRRGEATVGSRSLADLAIGRAVEIAESASHGRIDRRPAFRAAAAAATMLAAAGALLAASPETARIALLRLATPFADVQWPARTMVEPAMASSVHARGTALPLRARTVRGDPASMRVEAEYRVLRSGSGEWRTVLLSPQPDGSFERLVESEGDSVEVVFRTDDMETLPVTVRLVPAPGVEQASARIDPPAYAAAIVDVRTVELGDGTDRRATVSPPVLAGSRVKLALRMRGALSPPQDGPDRAEWIRRVVQLSGADGGALAPLIGIDSTDPSQWTIEWLAAGRGVVELRPEGEAGILPPGRIAFEIPSVEDAAPVVAVTEPAADESVTPEASPAVVAEARDDLRVERAWIEVSVVRGNEAPRHVLDADGTAGASARVERSIAIASTGAQPGDRVVCVPRATDGYERDGKRRDPVSGAPRIFRVLSSAELAEQVRSRLGQLRDAAARLREEQGGIADAMRAAAEGEGEHGADPEVRASERGRLAGTESRMADRVAAVERSLAELGERLERNRTDGAGIAETLREAQAAARSASRQATDAAAAAQQPASMAGAAEQAEAAERSLADLESMLQRDRETAELARRVDRLAEAVDSARRETQEATRESVGRPRGDLSEEARAGLDRAAQAQREAAGEARRLAEDLGRRADELEGPREQDPGAAEAMREAKEEAERRGLARQLEQAARQTEQNQGQAAQESQRQAGEAVQAMQQALRNQQRRRTEEFERRMTDVVESMRALLGSIGERSLPMQRLTADDAAAVAIEADELLRIARNAAGVAERAGASGPALRRAGALVERGSVQLDESAVALRADPPAVEPARASFDAARRSVEEALASAEQARRDAEKATENRRREELRGIYERILEVQRSARSGTESVLPAPGKRMDRRGFIESRRIAAEQGAVTGLLEAASSRPDVRGSELYSVSTEEMTAASRLSAKDLSAAAVSRRTVLLQREVELALGSLIEALADPPEPDDPFARAPGTPRGDGAGGQGGGQPGGEDRVPPMAELRLLRAMAQRVLDDTRAAAELPESDRTAYLGRVAERQRRITELGERWMKEMQRRSAQGGGEGEAK